MAACAADYRSWWQSDEPRNLFILAATGRAIIGLAFDPNNANNLWISHNNPLFPQPAEDFKQNLELTLKGTILRLMFRLRRWPASLRQRPSEQQPRVWP